MNGYKIIPATKEDAAFLAQALMVAIGAEVCADIASDQGRLRKVFARTAARTDSQYSYLNALVAVTDDGARAGAIIGYDGALLHKLRQAFVDEYNAEFGTRLTEEEFDDETDPEEIYIDTLMVLPEHRRRGLAGKLIAAFGERHGQKPLGLLVDYTNPHARALYVKAGFSPAGPRPFCGTMMEHMVRPLRSTNTL